ncbi:uncharacterized protein RCC_01912 [Ramularia collo-cygni]|uniref:BTB domain-containing protein n=1 Tax=Ramularia collo-cygni TaxID=112498 RepID=A0A2D3UM54_9PEZI|nr:uncharacterized protein RCC_01912 [Ramularia collo-cygni]CZT16072.1 uncharacterized protein RCC_01912 [Ramularia collo-cygni]
MTGRKQLRVSRRLDMIDDRIVKIRAGPEGTAKEFSVHEAILRESSPFFRTALDKKWREGRSRRIDLPQDDGEVVAAFLDWSYFKIIASRPVSPPELPMDDGEFDFLARLYCFAEKVLVPSFADDVIDAMALKTDDVAKDGTRTFPSHSAITLLYTGTPSGSPARRFVCDMYCEFGISAWIPKESGLNHPEFLQDLVRAALGDHPRRSTNKHSNYPRRRKWHKCGPAEEFLQLAPLGERAGEAS